MEKKEIKKILTVANYYKIEQQLKKCLNAYGMSNDAQVIGALKGLVETELINSLPDDPIILVLIDELLTISDSTQAELFLASIKPHVIPFPKITEAQIKKIFKKEKKLKLPSLDRFDLTDMNFLAWDDAGNQSRYFILEENGQYKGIKGNYDKKSISGVCSLCNHHGNVALFTTSIKGKIQGTYKKHSNYICQDIAQCNNQISDIQDVHDFFERTTK